MSVSMYKISVPVFIQFLSALTDVINKAEAHINEKRIDESFMLNMRLYPDMYPFVLQVQQCCTHAERICSVLAGKPELKAPNTEKSFGELKTRIARTIEHLKGFAPEDIDGTEDKVLDMGGRKLPGQILLLNRILPHFYFHCTTAYDILRHCGVPLIKHDFLGTPLELLGDPVALHNWSFSR
jgi:hypothetical protein